jgi:hypothetical protein
LGGLNIVLLKIRSIAKLLNMKIKINCHKIVQKLKKTKTGKSLEVAGWLAGWVNWDSLCCVG